MLLFTHHIHIQVSFQSDQNSLASIFLISEYTIAFRSKLEEESKKNKRTKVLHIVLSTPLLSLLAYYNTPFCTLVIKSGLVIQYSITCLHCSMNSFTIQNSLRHVTSVVCPKHFHTCYIYT